MYEWPLRRSSLIETIMTILCPHKVVNSCKCQQAQQIPPSEIIGYDGRPARRRRRNEASLVCKLRCVIGMTRNLLSSRCFLSQHYKQHNSETASLLRKRTFPAFAPKFAVNTNGFIFILCNMGAGVHPLLSKLQLPRE